MCDGCKVQYVGTGETCYYCANRPNQGLVEPTPQDKPEDRSAAGATDRLAAVSDSLDRLRKLSIELKPCPHCGAEEEAHEEYREGKLFYVVASCPNNHYARVAYKLAVIRRSYD